MLTIKSRFTNFYNRQGSEVSAADLDILKQLISPDLINFRGNISYGFSESIAKAIVARIAVSKTAKICLQNDTSFHLYLELLKAGFDPANIYIAVGKWHVSGKTVVPSKTDSTYAILKRHAAASFNEEINIIELKEIFNMKFDLIIANPPYGSIGANITKTIIDNVQFDYYINLLPANDYKRNSTKDLFNYQSDMEPINDGFKDAAVTTHLARIHKRKINNMSLVEFEASQYIDRQLDKYFSETNKRKYKAFENNDQGNHPELWTTSRTVIMGFKDSANGHMPYSKDCNTYRWNVERSIDSQWIIANCNYYAKSGRGVRVPFVGFTFDTDLEHDNFITFFYSSEGFKFMSKVITALNADSWVGTNKYLPKVDWTRAWTVEEILVDYGYTTDEIADVIADLENFKDMERD